MSGLLASWTSSGNGATFEAAFKNLWYGTIEPFVQPVLDPVFKEIKVSVILPAIGVATIPTCLKQAASCWGRGERGQALQNLAVTAGIVGYAATEPLKEVATVAVGVYALYQTSKYLTSCCFSKRKYYPANEEFSQRIMCPNSKCYDYFTIRFKNGDFTAIK